jgi:hypothetical protein
LREPQIIKQWETTEINPEEIAEYLQGKLEESDDADSRWNIHLYYKRKKIPLITLKLDPEKRKIFLTVNRSKNSFYGTIKLADVESLLFVHYYDPQDKREHTDIRIQAHKGEYTIWDIIISSKGHYSFGCKREKCR